MRISYMKDGFRVVSEVNDVFFNFSDCSVIVNWKEGGVINFISPKEEESRHWYPVEIGEMYAECLKNGFVDLTRYKYGEYHKR